MSISLIIKGNKTEAWAAAYKRGICVDVLREREESPARGIETIALARNKDRDRIVRWLAETDQGPFLIGTLMLFTDLD